MARRRDGAPAGGGPAVGDVRAEVAAALRADLVNYQKNGVPHPPALDAWLAGVEAAAEVTLPGYYCRSAGAGWVTLAGDRAVPAGEPRYGLIDRLGI